MTLPIEYITIGGGLLIPSGRVERVFILWKTRGQNEQFRQRDSTNGAQCVGLCTKKHRNALKMVFC